MLFSSILCLFGFSLARLRAHHFGAHREGFFKIVSNERASSSTRRTTRRKAAQTMTRIYEDETLSENEDTGRAASARSRTTKKKSQTRKEPKPGYCENCRDKYDDFNEVSCLKKNSLPAMLKSEQHIETKTHKKFALNAQNWTELDALLVQLERR